MKKLARFALIENDAYLSPVTDAVTEPSPLNIVHVVRQFHPAIGGMENYVEQLALHQVAEGHRVRVVTLNRVFDSPTPEKLPGIAEHRGIEIRRVPFSGPRRYPVARGVLPLIVGADLVHVHGVDFFADFIAATVAVHRRPMILTTHGGFFHTNFARRFKRLYFKTVTRASLSQFGAVIACSEADARLFQPVAGSRLRLVSNPVDIEKFAGLADPSSRTLLYFGRLAPNKGLLALIRWFAGLAAAEKRWKLIVAGKPMGMDIADLRSHVEALGLSDRVEIFDTPTDQELRALISRSSIYCCASTYEGFGLAAIEAASAGLFPVLSTIPAFRSSLERLGFGMLIDFDDEAGWPESYGSLDRQLAEFHGSYGANEVRRAVEPFSWKGAIREFADVYERVLGRTTRKIGAVEVAVQEREAATELILQAAYAGRPMMITFCNAHTANLASRNAALRDALQQATVLNDGVGLEIASRLLFRSAFPANLNGTDFVPHLMASAGGSLRVFLLGGEPGIAEKAARRILSSQPTISIAGTMHGYFDEGRSSEIVERINQSGANVILVAMGQPRQELWAARHFQDLRGPVLCVGALFDFLAERVPRAPAAVRRLRLEWAFRLMNEPRRLWRRYLLGNAAFLARVVRQRLVGTRL